MNHSNDQEYLFTIEFPNFTNYPGDFVLNVLAKALAAQQVPPLHDLEPQIYENKARATQVDANKEYFSNRFLKLAHEGEIELWDLTNEMVSLPPPSPIDQDSNRSPKIQKTISWEEVALSLASKHFPILDGSPESLEQKPMSGNEAYENYLRTPRPRVQKKHIDPLWWVILSTIQKADLIKFCNAQRIKVVFEELPDLDSPPNAQTVIDVAVDTNTPPQPKHKSGPPGSIPPGAIGKLVVKIAWEIECKTGKRVTPDDLMKELRQRIDDKRDIYVLHSKKDVGINWILKSGETKYFSPGACEKALTRWNESRLLATSEQIRQ